MGVLEGLFVIAVVIGFVAVLSMNSSSNQEDSDAEGAQDIQNSEKPWETFGQQRTDALASRTEKSIVNPSQAHAINNSYEDRVKTKFKTEILFFGKYSVEIPVSVDGSLDKGDALRKLKDKFGRFSDGFSEQSAENITCSVRGDSLCFSSFFVDEENYVFWMLEINRLNQFEQRNGVLIFKPNYKFYYDDFELYTRRYTRFENINKEQSTSFGEDSKTIARSLKIFEKMKRSNGYLYALTNIYAADFVKSLSSVQIEYARDIDDETGEFLDIKKRTIKPLAHVHIYIVAWDVDASAIRVFSSEKLCGGHKFEDLMAFANVNMRKMTCLKNA